MDIVVPWKFTEEWKAVGELIYSQDAKKLKRAYEMLRGWKSRCSKLPAGAECTIIILEALLLEDEMKDVLALQGHNVLASCYSMALTRFLNLASSFEKERTYFSLYRIARHLNLPEWIVNLRHQSSHGLELPSLVVLKAGLTLALDWLDKEYWKSELYWKTLESSDSLVEKFKTRLSSLVASYQDIMKQKMCMDELHGEEDQSSLESIMKPYVTPSDDTWLLAFGSNEEIVEEVPDSLNECLEIIVGKLRSVLKAAEKRSLNLGLLLQHFLWNSLFLPSEDALNLYSHDLNRNILPREMIILWCTFLEEVIHKAGLLATFIQKLIDFKSRQEMPQRWASIWVKYLASLLKKAQVCKRVLDKQKKKGVRQLSRKSDVMVSRKERKQPQGMITFDVEYLPGKEELNPIIEDVICNPRKSALVYITELLELYEEPFSNEKATMIIKAIEIQLQSEDDSALTEMEDISVDMRKIEEFCDSVVSEENLVNNGKRNAEDKESTDSSCDWEFLPLGVHPGYHQRIKAQEAAGELEDEVVYFCE